ncbi:hypothetical protein CFP56_042024 [Quercus suber]|uniref:Uncharacterized protein n=1 Tax=Quercus suber TaxID=58331 RepID=A0AAW0IUH1_QUESU
MQTKRTKKAGIVGKYVRCMDFFCFHLQPLYFSLIHVHFLFLQSSGGVHSDLDDEDRHMSFCASGLRPNSRCTCGTFFLAEEPSIHASIFQILMLADALFEVDFPPLAVVLNCSLMLSAFAVLTV